MDVQISARVSHDLNERIEAYSDENDCSKSDAIRELLEAGLENDETKAENQRLRNQLASVNRRIDETNELVEYVREERDLEQSRHELEQRRAQAGIFTRAKWWLVGMDDE